MNTMSSKLFKVIASDRIRLNYRWLPDTSIKMCCVKMYVALKEP